MIHSKIKGKYLKQSYSYKCQLPSGNDGSSTKLLTQHQQTSDKSANTRPALQQRLAARLTGNRLMQTHNLVVFQTNHLHN